MRDLFDEPFGQLPLDPNESARQSSRAPQRKRFYAHAGTKPVAGDFGIVLDDKPVRTPSRNLLAAPSQTIADAIAAEWEAQQDVIDPLTMPLTRLANSAIDGVVGRVDLVVEDIAQYFGSDLLFYRAGHPAELVARETMHWDPVLFWAAETLGAHFILAEGIVHVRQPDEAIAAARAALPSDPWTTAALHIATTLTGSALLAVALMRGRLTPDEVWVAAHVDEDWNSEQWGVDQEVADRRAARRRDFQAAAMVLEAMRPGVG